MHVLLQTQATTLSYQISESCGVLLLLWGLGKLLLPTGSGPSRLCPGSGMDVAWLPRGVLQPCSSATKHSTTTAMQAGPAAGHHSKKGLKSQKVPGWRRRLFGLGGPVAPNHPFCRSKQNQCK